MKIILVFPAGFWHSPSMDTFLYQAHPEESTRCEELEAARVDAERQEAREREIAAAMCDDDPYAGDADCMPYNEYWG